MPITYVRAWVYYSRARHWIAIKLLHPHGRFVVDLKTDWREGNVVTRCCIRPTHWALYGLFGFELWFFKHVICRIEDALKRKAALAAPQSF